MPSALAGKIELAEEAAGGAWEGDGASDCLDEKVTGWREELDGVADK